ncbi:MAG: bifunctional hydroxymethylpyrimidine kinase/phosphomethylpyrimidine kinase [Ruminococcus sp.]|nr:bifunctional hydroxymethylpyrimidine kinase/phosphomethylpyrimidine kinase [Ruminococcus sp.]
MKTALTIAGSDCSGGAGIQADLKTMLANGVYGMSAITALTAQNTLGVTAISEVTPEFLRQQLDAICTDIFPDAVKTGMVVNEALIQVIAQRLRFYHVKYIVVDPVMIATSGARLISERAVAALKEELLPMATVITPNIPEAEVLSGIKITSKSDMEKAAGLMNESYGCAVLLKGGHSIGDADDLLYEQSNITWFTSVRIDNPNTHGTGCTLSAAIASNLAKGHDLKNSVQLAKTYISGALSAFLDLGSGNGPLHHGYSGRLVHSG